MPNTITGQEYYEFDPFGGYGGDASQIVAPEEDLSAPIPDLQPEEVAQFNQWVNENKTIFIEKAQQWGRSRELEAVMRGNGMSSQDIDNIFEPANNVYAMEQLRNQVEQNVRGSFEKDLARGIAMDESDWNTYRDFYSQNIFDGIGKDGYESEFVKDLMAKSQTFQRFFEAAKNEGYNLDSLVVQRNGRFVMDFSDARGRKQSRLAHYDDGNVRYATVYVNPNTGEEIDKTTYDKMDGSVEQGFFQAMETPLFEPAEQDRSGKWMYDPQEKTFVKLSEGYSSTKYNSDDVRLDNGLYVNRVGGVTQNDLYADYMRNDAKWEIDANSIIFGNGMRLTDKEALAVLGRDMPKEREASKQLQSLKDGTLSLAQYAEINELNWDEISPSVNDVVDGIKSDLIKDGKSVSIIYDQDISQPVVIRDRGTSFEILVKDDGNAHLTVDEYEGMFGFKTEDAFNWYGGMSDKPFIEQMGTALGMAQPLLNSVSMNTNTRENALAELVVLSGTAKDKAEAEVFLNNNPWITEMARTLSSQAPGIIREGLSGLKLGAEALGYGVSFIGASTSFGGWATRTDVDMAAVQDIYGSKLPPGVVPEDLTEAMLQDQYKVGSYAWNRKYGRDLEAAASKRLAGEWWQEVVQGTLVDTYREHTSLFEQIAFEIIGTAPLDIATFGATKAISPAIQMAKAASRVKVATATVKALSAAAPPIGGVSPLSVAGMGISNAQRELKAAQTLLKAAKSDVIDNILFIQTRSEAVNEVFRNGIKAAKKAEELKADILAKNAEREVIPFKLIDDWMEARVVADDTERQLYAMMLGKEDQVKGMAARIMGIKASKGMSDLDKLAEMEKIVFSEDSMRKMGDMLNTTKLGRGVLQMILPGGNATTSRVSMGAFMFGIQRAQSQALAMVEVSAVRRLNRVLNVTSWGRNAGKTKNVKRLSESEFRVNNPLGITAEQIEAESVVAKGAVSRTELEIKGLQDEIVKLEQSLQNPTPESAALRTEAERLRTQINTIKQKDVGIGTPKDLSELQTEERRLSKLIASTEAKASTKQIDELQKSVDKLQKIVDRESNLKTTDIARLMKAEQNTAELNELKSQLAIAKAEAPGIQYNTIRSYKNDLKATQDKITALTDKLKGEAELGKFTNINKLTVQLNKVEGTIRQLEGRSAFNSWTKLQKAKDDIATISARLSQETSVVDEIAARVVDEVAPYTQLSAGAEQHANHILRVLQHPKEYVFTSGRFAGKTVEEAPEFKMMQRIINDRLELLSRNGINIKELDLAEGVYYFHQAAKGIKPSDFTKFRKIDDVAEGLAQGIKYEWDYRAVLEKMVNDSYNLVARKNFIDYVSTMAAPSPATKSKGIISGLQTMRDTLEAMSVEYRTTGKVQDMKSLREISRLVHKSVKGGSPVEEVAAAIAKRQQKISNSIKWAEKQVGKELSEQGLRNIKSKGTEGLVFRKEIADEIDKVLAPYRVGWDKKNISGTALKGISSVAQLVRTGMTAIDFGAPMIHGMPLLYVNGKAWGTGWLNMWKATGTEKFIPAYITRNLQSVRDAVTKGHMIFDGPEFMEGAGLIKKIPLLGTGIKPFERAFTGFLDVSRIELWKSMYRSDMTAKEAMEVGNYVDKLLGSIHASKMGIKANQSMIEALALFAPRYYRSQLSLMADMFRGGLRGGNALRAMASNFAGHHMAYVGMCEALGQDPILDPTDSRYLKFKIGDAWFGEAGFMRGWWTLTGRVVTEIAEGTPDRILYRLGRFGQGKMSRLAQLGYNIINGKNFIGEGYGKLVDGEVEVDWARLLKEEGVSSLPFWMQAWFDDSPGFDNPDKALATVFEVAGMTSMPDQLYLQTKDYLEKTSQERHGVGWLALNGQEGGAAAAISIMQTPEYKALKKSEQADAARKSASYRDKGALERIEYIPLRNQARDNLSVGVNKAYEQHRQGNLTDREVREKQREYEAEYSKELADLTARYPNVYEDMDKYEKNLHGASRDVINYTKYLDEVKYNPKLYSDEFEKRTANMSEDDRNVEVFKLYDGIRADYISQYGEEAYVQSRMLSLKDRGFDDGYIVYKVDMDVISMTRDEYGKSYWDYVADKDREGKMDFLFDHPEIESNLYVHGYLSSLQTLDAYDFAKNKIEDLGIKKGVPLPLDRKEAGAPKYMYDRLNELKAATGRGSEKRSDYAIDITNRWFDVTNSIYALEDAARLAKTEEQKERIINELYSAIAQAQSLTSELNSSGASDPHTDELKQRMAIFERENRTRLSRIAKDDQIPRLE